MVTHLLEAEARHDLSEIRRVLRPGRPAVTALLFEGAQPSVARAFPHSPAPGLRRRRRARSAAAVAWEKARFVEMADGAGLRLQWRSPGYYPGREFLPAQDVLLLGH